MLRTTAAPCVGLRTAQGAIALKAKDASTESERELTRVMCASCYSNLWVELKEQIPVSAGDSSSDEGEDDSSEDEEHEHEQGKGKRRKLDALLCDDEEAEVKATKVKGKQDIKQNANGWIIEDPKSKNLAKKSMRKSTKKTKTADPDMQTRTRTRTQLYVSAGALLDGDYHK